MSHRRFKRLTEWSAKTAKQILCTLLRTGSFCSCAECDKYHAQVLRDLNDEIALDDIRNGRAVS